MRRIADYSLWVGHIGDTRDLRRLLSAGIHAVIDLALEEPPAVITRELVYGRFPLVDGAGNPSWLLHAAVDCAADLLRRGIPTLIFCGAGMSRSPAIAAAAISRVHNCTLTDALVILTASGAADVSPGLWSDVQAILK